MVQKAAKKALRYKLTKPIPIESRHEMDQLLPSTGMFFPLDLSI